MEKKINNVAVCIFCGLLTATGIAVSSISLANGSGGIWTAKDIINLLLIGLICYYSFVGYRKPHNNLLKSIMLIDAVCILVGLYINARNALAFGAVLKAVEIGLICYVAGRLHRVRQNYLLMIIVFVLMLLGGIEGASKGVMTIGALSSRIIWVDICAAYFLRYKEHKEAGLSDLRES